MIDEAALMQDFEGDEEILREACLTFLAEMGRMLDDVRAAVAAGEAKSIERAAHTFKGASSTFRAAPAIQAAAALESAAKRDRLEAVGALLAALEAEVPLLAGALNGLLAGPLAAIA